MVLSFQIILCPVHTPPNKGVSSTGLLILYNLDLPRQEKEHTIKT